MMIFKKSIPRRTFLRGAGASLALPFLDAMVPAFAASEAARPPRRLGYIYLPTGRIIDNWTPKTQGQDYDMTPSLAPFAPYREKMLVLSGLDLKAADFKPGEAGAEHPRSCGSFLTGKHPFSTTVGISADQAVAKVLGQQTPLASLQLGLDPAEWSNGNDGGFRGFYRTTVSWASKTTALPTQNNPRKVFERLFGDTSSLDPETQRRLNQNRGSVLDAVNERVKNLMGTLDAGDRYKMAEYLDAVRDIERGIQAAESRSDIDSAGLESVKRPAGIPETYTEHAKLIFDMMHLAYLTDMTQVVTVMMGHEGGNRTFVEKGFKEGHHSLSHHRGIQGAIETLKQIDHFQNELIAYFLEKMQSTKELDGSSLLDNSMIMAGSSMSDANTHVHYNLPIVVFGGAQGRLKTGRHIRYDDEPLSNLHLFTIDAFGASPEEYVEGESDATGILKGLS
jgi:hypothetical protein